ncbi:hypothetical protein HYY69_01680 [Candidatus Woesearchaeota archaeon]|nr:hypothetical protein [Candidatus Woesearchaeota archaeon]
MYKPSILVVEPEIEIRDALLGDLRHRGYPIVTAGDGLQALVLMKFMAEHGFKLPLVVTNVDLPVVDHPSLDHALDITGLDLTTLITGVGTIPHESDIETYLFEGDEQEYADFKKHYSQHDQPTNVLLLPSSYIDAETRDLATTFNSILSRRSRQRVGSLPRDIPLNKGDYTVDETRLRTEANKLLSRPLDPYSAISEKARREFAQRVHAPGYV